jgi:hypothetical protein
VGQLDELVKWIQGQLGFESQLQDYASFCMLHLAYVLGKFYLTSLWGSCLICKMSIKLVSISGL